MENIDTSWSSRIARSVEQYTQALCKYAEAKAELDNYCKDKDSEIFVKISDVNSLLFRACDPILRALVIKYNISCPASRNNWVTITTSENDDIIKLYTAQFCQGIARYNFEANANGHEQILLDADLQPLIDIKEELRNPSEHLALLSNTCELYNVFLNLYKVIKTVDPDIDVGLPSVPANIFNWDIFSDRLNDFDATQKRLILIVSSSLHSYPHEDIRQLMRIPWCTIFDFDGTSEYGGLYAILKAGSIPIRALSLSNFSNVSDIVQIGTEPFYINLYNDVDSDIYSRSITASTAKTASDRIPLQHLAKNVLYSTNYADATILILGYPSDRVNDICSKIQDNFRSTNIVCICTGVNIPDKMLTKSDDDEIDAGVAGVITDSEHINCDLPNMFACLNRQERLLPSRTCKIDIRDGYKMPVPGEQQLITIIDKEKVKNLEKSFEFLHIMLCKGTDTQYSIQDKDKFLRGGPVTWENIINGDSILTIDQHRLKSFENEIENAMEKRNLHQKNFHLIHKPGFGGSTLGRMIAWDLHEKIPVFILKSFSSTIEFKEQIQIIYRLLNNNSFLILIDENNFAGSTMADIESVISLIDVPAFGLLIYRKPSDEKYSFKASDKNYLTLYSFHDDSVKIKFKLKCSEIINNQSVINFRWINMTSSLQENMQCPLIINLYLLVENFTLENYVKKFIYKIPSDITGNNLRKALLYISMCDYYGNLSFSAAMIGNMIGLTRKRDIFIREALTPVNDLLIESRDDDGSLQYKTRHYLIAQEMLRQLSKSSETMLPYAVYLPEITKDFIKFILTNCINNKIDKIIQILIRNLFTDKTADRRLFMNASNDTDYTLLLEDIPDENKAEIIFYLAKKIGEFIERNVEEKEENYDEYKLLAHIYAKCAQIANDVGEKIELIEEYCTKTEYIIKVFHLKDADLEHMLGMCHLNKGENLSMSDSFDVICKALNNAIVHFDNATKFGSPGWGIPMKLRAVTSFMNKYCEYKSIKSNITQHIMKEKEAVEFLRYGYSAVQEIKDYRISEISDDFNSARSAVFAIRYRDEFIRCCFPDDPSKALEELNNLLDTIPIEDKAGYLVVTQGIIQNIQRKYYNQDTKRYELLIRAYAGDSRANKDARTIFEHLNNLIMGGYNVLPAEYKMWFDFAKFCEISIKTGLQVVRNFTYSIGAEDETNLLWAKYYSYVLSLLLYIKVGIGTTDDILEKLTELATAKRHFQRTTYITTIRDWFSIGNEMGSLISSSVISVSDSAKSSRLLTVEGLVVDMSEHEGFLSVESLPRLKKIGRPTIGSNINRKACVFFSPLSSGISKDQVGSDHKIKFRFGFSFDKMEVSRNSLVDLNIEKSKIDSTSVHSSGNNQEPSTKKFLWFQPSSQNANGSLSGFVRIGNTNMDAELLEAGLSKKERKILLTNKTKIRVRQISKSESKIVVKKL
jgi:hypothetical protein